MLPSEMGFPMHFWISYAKAIKSQNFVGKLLKPISHAQHGVLMFKYCARFQGVLTTPPPFPSVWSPNTSKGGGLVINWSPIGWLMIYPMLRWWERDLLYTRVVKSRRWCHGTSPVAETNVASHIATILVCLAMCTNKAMVHIPNWDIQDKLNEPCLLAYGELGACPEDWRLGDSWP